MEMTGSRNNLNIKLAATGNWVCDEEEIGLHSWWCQQARGRIEKKPYLFTKARGGVYSRKRMCLVFGMLSRKYPWNIQVETPNWKEVLGKGLRFRSHQMM